MKAHVLAFLAVVAAFAWCYGPGLGHGFSSDDFVMLEYSRVTSAAEIVRERLLRGPRTDVASPWWRPGWLLVLNAGYEGFGMRPAAWRAALWTLHLLVAALVCRVAWRATAHRGLAIAAAALFAVSPAYAEALLWISAATNVLPAALCLLVAALAWARAVEGGARAARLVAWAAFLLSFLFREAAYHMPLVVCAAQCTLAPALPLRRRVAAGVLHALPFGAVVVLHNVLLNPFTVGELSLGENLAVAARHGIAWLHELFALPARGTAALGALAAFAVWFWRASPRVRFCLAWAAAASFPFVVRSHETRFLYFAHTPLALACALTFADSRRVARAGTLVLLALAALNATRVPAKVRAGAEAAAVNDSFLVAADDPRFAGAGTVHVDLLPPELANGAREMLALRLGRDVEVVQHLLLEERPPFLIFGNPAFPDLPGAQPMLHFARATRRFARTTKDELVAGRPVVPLLAFRHVVRTVDDWAEVRFDPAVVHLKPPLPDLDLTGEGTAKVVWVRAGTVQRFDVGVDVPRDGYLVVAFVAELTAIGGRAFVDGAPAPLLVADGLFNAVPVRRGSREVVIKASP